MKKILFLLLIIILVIGCDILPIRIFKYITFEDLRIKQPFVSFTEIRVYVDSFQLIENESCHIFPWEMMALEDRKATIRSRILLFLYCAKESKLFQMEQGGKIIEQKRGGEKNWVGTDDLGNPVYGEFKVGFINNSTFGFNYSLQEVAGNHCP